MVFGYVISRGKNERKDLVEKCFERVIYAIKVALKERELPEDTKIHDFDHENKTFLFVLENEDNYDDVVEGLKTK